MEHNNEFSLKQVSFGHCAHVLNMPMLNVLWALKQSQVLVNLLIFLNLTDIYAVLGTIKGVYNESIAPLF